MPMAAAVAGGSLIAFHPRPEFTQTFSANSGEHFDLWRLDLSRLLRK